MTFFELVCLILLGALALILSQQRQHTSASRKMGCASSMPEANQQPRMSHHQQTQQSHRREVPPAGVIGDNFSSLAEVEQALRKAGLESSDIILAIDFTKSNTWQGTRTFGGRSLHALDGPGGVMNPYQAVITTLSDVLLKRLDDDCEVPMIGFGDKLTGNRKVFLLNNEQNCRSKDELLFAYSEAASRVTLSGPTSFAPVIRDGIDVCKATGKYHIIFIVADGCMDDVEETKKAIAEASKHPLSIVMIGLGDGPWDQMEEFDDSDQMGRDFDNFQFVSFTKLQEQYRDPEKRAMRFALESLMELPEQYQAIKRAGLLGRAPVPNVPFANRLRGQHIFPLAQAPSSAPEGVFAMAPGGVIPPPAYAPR